MKAKDIMSRDVITLSPGNSVAHAAQIMLDNAISGLPVLDNDGILVGVVTEGDLIRRMGVGLVSSSGISTREATDSFVKSHSWRVEDAMTKPAIAVDEQATVEDIALIFTKRNIKRVLVVREGQLVGVVSRADMLGLIARTKPPAIAAGDEALRISIVARVREALPAATPPTVTVVGGAIHLDGTIRNENERRAIHVVVDGVPGASVVHDHMRAEQGDVG
jgi:CBS domain-containing protein